MSSALEEFIKKTLTVYEFQQLPSWLQTSKTRLTQLLNAPETARPPEIENLAKILQMSPLELISQYRLGFNVVTLAQMDAYKDHFKNKRA